MILLEMLTALFFAAFFTALFSFAFRLGPGREMLFLFIIIFLLTWAGGLWLTPFGPYIWGVQIFPFLFFALMVALLIGAFSRPWFRPRTKREATQEAEIRREERIIVNGMIWVFIAFLIFAIIVRYLFPLRVMS
ncbi:MAG: hypothetical protein GF401_16450 [Chitinivibrionales bacterium]|nr:hypothetical protein [Chitinivibrionales bacterium]